MIQSHPTRSLCFALISVSLVACNGGRDSSLSTAQANQLHGPVAASARPPTAAFDAQLDLGEEIVLRSPAGRVHIQRDPFQTRYYDAQGRLVLQQVPASGTALQPGLVLDEPVGGELIADATLHAPLSYLVGAQLSPQYRASPWVGNYLTQAMSGIQYHACLLYTSPSPRDS